MNNLMKITASLALAILSGCVGSINAGDIGIGGNNNGSNALNPITANSSEFEILLSKVNSVQNVVSSVNFLSGGRIARHSNAVQVQHAGNAIALTVSDRRYTLRHTRQTTQYQIIESSRDDPDPDSYLFRIERDDLTSVLDPSAPKDYILFNYFARGDSIGSIGFGVTGIQTPLDTIPTTSIATYSGKAYIDGIEPFSDGTFGFNFNISARQNMTVDFAQNTISGSMTNIVDDSNAVAISSDAEITFEETTFNRDGSYRGNIGIFGLQVLGIDSLNGNTFYRGETYGANAASLAGVVEFQGLTTGRNQFYAIGGFYADK